VPVWKCDRARTGKATRATWAARAARAGPTTRAARAARLITSAVRPLCS
jgi:hypothetical protein